MRTWKASVNVGVWEGLQPIDPAFIHLTNIRELKLGVPQSFFPLKFPRQTHKLSSLLFDQRWDQPWSKAAFPAFLTRVCNLSLRTPQTYKSLQNLSIHCQLTTKKHMENSFRPNFGRDLTAKDKQGLHVNVKSAVARMCLICFVFCFFRYNILFKG